MYPYPESQELTNYKDILINRIFTFGPWKTCLIVSPLFWACVVFGLIIFYVVHQWLIHNLVQNFNSYQFKKNEDEQPIFDLLDSQVFTL